MTKSRLIKFGALLYVPALAVAVVWFVAELVFGEKSVDRWVDSLPDILFWTFAAVLLAGLMGLLFVWWGHRRHRNRGSPK